MKKIALVDGYGFVFRAFHSLPPLTRSDKTPVGAVYGFTNMLIKLIAGLDVSHIAVVFDSGSKTFRNEIYPEYKANRPPCPPDLKPQFPIVRACAEALNLAVLEKVGFEADDIIATIAKKSEAAGYEVVIVSSDKDLMQLVSEHVLMFDAMKNKLVGQKEVIEKFSVEPKKVLEILSLIGDASDNIPGVRGIGPKTAAELINEFGNIENLFNNLDSIKQERRRQLLIDGQKDAILSKKLATLDENVELGITLSDLEIKAIEPDKLINFLQEQGFRSLILKVKKEFGLENQQENQQLSFGSAEFNHNSETKNFIHNQKNGEQQKSQSLGENSEERNYENYAKQNVIQTDFVPIKSRLNLDILQQEAIKNGQITIDYLANDRELLFITLSTSPSLETPKQIFYYEFLKENCLKESSDNLPQKNLSDNNQKPYSLNHKGLTAFPNSQTSIDQVNQSINDLPLFSSLNQMFRPNEVNQAKEYYESRSVSLTNKKFSDLRNNAPLSENIVINDFLPIIFDNSIRKILFNSKDFLRFLKFFIHKNYSESLANKVIFDDVSLQSYLLNSSIHNGLRELIETNLDFNFEENGFGDLLSKTEAAVKDFKFEDKSAEFRENFTKIFASESQKIAFFCSKNNAIFQLSKIFSGRIFRQKLNNAYLNYELPLIEVLAQMEFNGIKINSEKLKILSEEFTQKIKILSQEIYNLAGQEFNIASNKQLNEILFGKLRLNSSKKSKKTGAPSTSIRVLDELAEDGYEIAVKLREFRKFSKLKNTYADALPFDVNPLTGRIHTHFSNISTLTGRLTSTNPNLQNIPIKSEEGKKIRKCFTAEANNILIAADYSQIELRVIAHLAKIDNLIEAFKCDKDIHRTTAAQIFGVNEELVDDNMRNKAKAINFGIIYGISPYGLAKQLKISNSEASDYIDSYLKTYPGIAEFMSQQIDLARNLGFVWTISGRKCFIQNIHDAKHFIRSEAERQAINAPVQGSAADIIKKAMIRFQNKILGDNLPIKLVLQIHDELVIEVAHDFANDAAEILRTEMEKSFNLLVPLKVDLKISYQS